MAVITGGSRTKGRADGEAIVSLNHRATSRLHHDFMYWERVRDARARGCGVFHFGRGGRDTGASAFRCHRGFGPEPPRCRVHVENGAAAADRPASDGSARLPRWTRRRLPLPPAELVGPLLIRRFGVHCA